MKRRDPRATIVRGLLIAVATLPLIPRLLTRAPALAPLSHVLLRWFSFQCQRDPARSLDVLGQLLPVCARCSGIYWGVGLGALLLHPRLKPRGLRLWVAGASLLMLLDVLSEVFALRPAWAPLRVLSGALLSYPVSAALVHAARARSLASEPINQAD
ncbi:MAG: DUF2085 domain-containing protein [Polyangiaceae bacterium]